MRQQGRSQMTARRRTHDADAMRINFVIRRVRARPAHRAGHVLKFRRIMIPARAQPIFEHEAGDTVLIQPERVIATFVRREMFVTATGTNHHRRARRVGRVGQIRGEGRNILRPRAQRTGRAVGPERNGRQNFSA